MTEAQSAGLVMASCLYLVYCVSNSKTYAILAIIYAISAVSHFVFMDMESWSIWWPALYSTLDVAGLVAIIKLGDIRKLFHSLCLSALIIMHTLLSYDLAFDTGIVFEIYYQVVMTIIAAQILAGFGDAATEYRRGYSAYNRCSKHGDNATNHHQGHKA